MARAESYRSDPPYRGQFVLLAEHSSPEERMLTLPLLRLRLQPLVLGFGEGPAAVVVDRPVEIERAPTSAKCGLCAKELGPKSHRDDLVIDEPTRVDATLDLPGIETNALAVDRRSEQHEARVGSSVTPAHAREDRIVVVEQSFEPGSRSRSDWMGVRVEDEQVVGFDLADGEVKHVSMVVAGRCNMRLAPRILQDVHGAELAPQQPRGLLLSILIDHEDPVVVEPGEGRSRSVDQQPHPADVAEVGRQESSSLGWEAVSAHAADGTGSRQRLAS